MRQGSAKVLALLEDKTAATFVIPAPNAQAKGHTSLQSRSRSSVPCPEQENPDRLGPENSIHSVLISFFTMDLYFK